MPRLTLIGILLFLIFTVSAGGLERFEENGKIGLKDASGAVVLPASFDALGWSDGQFSIVGQITGYRQNNRWGLLNLKKEFITPAVYESLTYPGGDRVIVSKRINPYTTKFGCIDLQGKLVVPFSYDEIVLYGLRAVVMIKNGTRYEYGLIDLNDKTILPVKYQKIQPLGSLRYAVQNFLSKFAICREDGTWITDFTIDSISDFHFDLAILRQGWRHGVLDRNGEIKIEPSFREVQITGPGQVIVRKADEWKLVDAAYHDLQHLEADELRFEKNGWGRLTLDGKSGLVDDHLNIRWPLTYEYIGAIENGQAVVRSNGKYGLLHLDQSVVMPVEFDSVCVANNFVRTRQQLAGRASWNLYDTFGIKKTATSYDRIDPFNGKFFPVKNRGFWGGVDRYGVEQIACVYDSLIDVQEPWVVVKFKNNYGIITLDDQWGMMPQQNSFQLLDASHYLEQIDSLYFMKTFDGNVLYFTDNPLTVFPDHLLEHLPDGTEKEVSFQGLLVQRTQPPPPHTEHIFHESENLIGIQRDGKFGFIDRRGRLRIANRYDAIGEFHGGIAPVMLLGKWGFINTDDQLVIQPNFESVENFENGVARATLKGKQGLINLSGAVVLPFRYDSILALPDQLFLLYRQSLKGLADKDGNVLIEPRFDHLEVLSNGAILVQQGTYRGLLSRDGGNLLPIQYDFLEYLPEKNIYLARHRTGWETRQVK